MQERPLPMQGDMVRATLREVDPKGQTRRTRKLEQINERPNDFDFTGFVGVDNKGRLIADFLDKTVRFFDKRPLHIQVSCPYGKPGDLLWVRETFAYSAFDEYNTTEDDFPESKHPESWDAVHLEGFTGEWTKDGEAVKPKWRPPMFMPKWAARIWLEITGIRVERVQDISEEDAIEEGIIGHRGIDNIGVDPSDRWKLYDGSDDEGTTSATKSFHTLWDSINAKRGYGWDVNPYVWVIEFKRVEKPV